MTEHGAGSQGRLGRTRAGKAVIGRRALKDNGQICRNLAGCHQGSPAAHFFLGGIGRHQIDTELFPVQPPHGFRQGGAAQTAVKGLAQKKIVFLQIGKGDIRHNRRRHIDPETLFSLFLG